MHSYLHRSTIPNSQDMETTYVSINKWKDKVVELSHKNEWNNAIWRNVNAVRDYHTTSSQKKKDKYHMISLIFDNKNCINNPIYKKETDSQA